MKRRNKIWLHNAINYHVLKHKKNRDEKLWLFSAWRGRKYDDNSKYLFEYVNENCPEIDAVWICDNYDVINEIKDKGYKAEISSSVNGIQLQKKAGIVFYTNGIDDFGDFCYVYGAQTVALWHGTGFKKLYNANIEYGGLKLLAKHLKDSIFNFTYRDISISTSELASKWIIECFKVAPESIYITGLPRNDAFKFSYKKSDVLKDIYDANVYNYILYMPTYRTYNSDVIESTVEGLIHNSIFNCFLIDHNIRFLIKLHPLTSLSIVDIPNNYFILTGNDISSVQELMAISDVLITDYSSSIIDFAIQRKPTLLFTPDYKTYCNEVGIGEDIIELYRKHSKKSTEELAEAIIQTFLNPVEVMQLSNEINTMYESPIIKDTCFSENVVRTLETINSRSYICER